MNGIDLDQLVNPVSADSPCGEDLEYEPEFQELEQASMGKPEQQYGDTIQPMEPPDWKTVKQKSIELLEKSKDLRLGVYLTCASFNLHGWSGLHDGLKVVAALMEQYWDEIHPRLDPSDDNDPTLRVNVLLTLCDKEKMLQTVRNTPLIKSRPFGQFSLRDVQIARGDLSPVSDQSEPLSLSTIEAAFQDCDLDGLQSTSLALRGASDRLNHIESMLRDHIDVHQLPDMRPLADLLEAAERIVSENLARRGQPAENREKDNQDAAGSASGNPLEEVSRADTTKAGANMADKDTTSSPPGTVQSVGEIQSREDVIRVLDKVCQFFYRNEPSSPVPLLLKRAKKLISKDFMEILRNLVPDGLTQAEMIRGPEEDEDS
ncbi:MAG: type VI secretion system protein TssA [Planctomycetota bacterium]